MLHLIERRLDGDKAHDIVTINLSGKSSLSDHMVIATGTSQRHLAAMADKLLTELKEHGYRDVSVEGANQGADWVLIDAGDVIVHLFREEQRSFYALEKLWGAPSAASEPVVSLRMAT